MFPLFSYRNPVGIKERYPLSILYANAQFPNQFPNLCAAQSMGHFLCLSQRVWGMTLAFLLPLSEVSHSLPSHHLCVFPNPYRLFPYISQE